MSERMSDLPDATPDATESPGFVSLDSIVLYEDPNSKPFTLHQSMSRNPGIVEAVGSTPENEMMPRLVSKVMDIGLDHNPTECGACAEELVRALLSVMREPMESMLRAGGAVSGGPFVAANVWRAMIDAMLVP